MRSYRRDPVVDEPMSHDRNENAGEALLHMNRALTLLDEGDCPADIGAHLDLAINRLANWMQRGA